MIFKTICAVLLALTVSAAAYSQKEAEHNDNMFIATAYAGVIKNKYTYESSRMTLKMSDHDFMGGLYLQYINPSNFQANGFFYHSPDVNYSKVYGAHVNADGYFFNGNWGSAVAGVDVEYIRIRMDAKDNIPSLTSFKMDHDILFSMVRAGAKINIVNGGAFKLTVFPYAGPTRESLDGAVMVSSKYSSTKTDIKDIDWYPSWGINTTATMFHMVECTFKYLGRAQKDNYMNSFTAQLNVFPARNFVLSYQFKYMDMNEDGYDMYNILGAGIML